MPKLAVVTPWSSPFMYTAYVDATLNMQRPDGWDTRFIRGPGWCPARRHTSGCELALAWDADVICIIGADQVHPPDMLPKLIARMEQGYEVVSALVPCRGYVSAQDMQPFQPMAWRFRANEAGDTTINFYRGIHKDPQMIEVIDPAAGEMQEVNFIGSGVLMFHREHLLALKRPWFKETVNPETYQRYANMDCVFVWRLQMEAYARAWVDTTIKVKHCHIFQIDDTYQDRFADWKEDGVGPPDICAYTTVLDEQEVAP